MIRLLYMVLAGAVALSAGSPAVHGAPAVHETGECADGQAIEHTLGRYGYRVVMSGAREENNDRTVKLQVWENEDRDWVITEAFLNARRTCVVRTGHRLHMLH